MGTVAAFSTMFGKHHATGGQGGVVFTKNEEAYWRVRRSSDRGKPFGLTGFATNVLASLNMNGDELSAAIGRERLRKLPDTVRRRRGVARMLEEGCLGLRAIKFVGDRAGDEGSYWFTWFRVEADKLTASKLDVCQALEAEGLPVGSTYLHTISSMDWYRKRAVFGTSGYPWTSPSYKGDPKQVFELPNITAADAQHFRLGTHEVWTEVDVRDVIAAFQKVEGRLHPLRAMEGR
jgi:dTDP-4-amino-4,6-dideoxygalactose transaminase